MLIIPLSLVSVERQVVDPVIEHFLIQYFRKFLSMILEQSSKSWNCVVFWMIDIKFIVRFLKRQSKGIRKDVNQVVDFFFPQNMRRTLFDNEVQSIKCSISDPWIAMCWKLNINFCKFGPNWANFLVFKNLKYCNRDMDDKENEDRSFANILLNICWYFFNNT